MIEIVSVRDLRYHSPIEVPIEKKDVIRNSRYYHTIQYLYDDIRKKLAVKSKEIYGEENLKNIWVEVSALYDKNFLTKLISIWKEKVFKKSIEILEEVSLEKENEIIQNCLTSDSMHAELEKYFLLEFWKETSLSSMGK